MSRALGGPLVGLVTLLSTASWAGGGAAAPDPAARPGWQVFADPAHGLRIGHPAGFVLRFQDAAALSAARPVPEVSILFMNPTMAAGALAGIEPPDLQLRVFRASRGQSLEQWLAAAGLSSGAKPYPRAGGSGVEVCAATLIAPGCSVFVAGAGRIFQLTPVSLEGRAMIDSFAATP